MEGVGGPAAARPGWGGERKGIEGRQPRSHNGAEPRLIRQVLYAVHRCCVGCAGSSH